mgnify:CR=1 FL=1
MKTPATIFAAGTAFTPSVWPAKAAEVMPPKEAVAALRRAGLKRASFAGLAMKERKNCIAARRT